MLYYIGAGLAMGFSVAIPVALLGLFLDWWWGTAPPPLD